MIQNVTENENISQNNTENYQTILDEANYIPQSEKDLLLKDAEVVSTKEFKEFVNQMNELYKEQDNEILDTNKTYSTGRKETYTKYMGAKNEYDTTAIEKAKQTIQGSKRAGGRRTKSQWLQVANMIGTEIANKSNQEIEEIAYRTWQDERPNAKSSINREGQNYVAFTSDEWINAIYNSVKQARGNTSSNIRTDVKNYLQSINKGTTNEDINKFIDRASNFKLSETDNTNPQLRNLIEKIQQNNISQDRIENNNEMMYNGNSNLDLSNVKQGELKNDFYKALTPKQWARYHNKMNRIMNNTYGDLSRTDIIYGKVITTNIKNHKEQVTNIFKVSKNISNKINVIVEEANNYGYNGQELQDYIEELYGKENVIRYDISSAKYVRASTMGNDVYGNNKTNETFERESSERINEQINPTNVNEIKDKYKDKTDYLVLNEDDNYINLKNVVVKKELRNQGIGQSFLNDLINYADENDKIITLTPTSEFGTKEKLKKWYKNNGFVENKGKNTDFTISDTMYKKPSDPKIRYELSEEEIQAQGDNSAQNEIDRKINQSMTPKEAEQMIQRAFVVNKIGDWYDGKYKNGLEWIKSEGAEEVAMYIDNSYELQAKYVNSNEDILNEEYTIEDILDAYLNGTLTGKQTAKTQRLDISKDTGYESTKFYEPRQIQYGIEQYNKANERVTNANRQEVYKARADFIINAHNQNFIQELGLTQQEVTSKLKQWANYPKRAMDLSNRINENASMQNRWAGIENSSILNTISVSEDEMKSLVKEIKGNSTEYERQYITSTMLAIDTHTDFSNLTFDFSPDRVQLGSALADYNPNTDLIRVGRSGQNTIAHEIGHYIDHLWGRQIWGNNLGITDRNNNINNHNLTENQKQFMRNFYKWFDSIESGADIRSKYTQTPTEVFARFIGRFTEWTKNVATNNRYNYESKWYNDSFSESQYIEFAKLLQEKSLLDTTENFANYKKEKYGGAKIEADRLDEFFEKSSNERKIVDAVTREELNGKPRKHLQSIYESDQIGQAGKDIALEEYKKLTYTPVSNLETITKVNDNSPNKKYKMAEL